MIRSQLDVLLGKVQDEALRADLRAQIDRLRQRRSFGLGLQQHIPERVRLLQHPKVDDGSLRVLDLMQPAVRQAVQAIGGGKVTALYESELSRPYPSLLSGPRPAGAGPARWLPSRPR